MTDDDRKTVLVGWQVYKDGKHVDSGDILEDAVAARHAGDFVWLRVTEPEAREIHQLTQEFDLPELAVEDAVQAHQRPKLERYHDTLFAVLKPAIYDDDAETITLGEIHVFSGPDYCITIRHGVAGTFDDVCRRLEQTPNLTALGPAAVLYAVADHIVDAYSPVITELEYDITEIETAVFEPDVQPPTERIYALMREVLDFQRATASLLLPMEDLARGQVEMVDQGLNPYFRDVADHARLAHERSENFRELLHGALQANVAFIGLQENRDQRKISAWAAVALVPTIIGGLWGMNVQRLPFSGSPLGFWVLMLLMLGASGYLYWRLRRNNWL